MRLSSVPTKALIPLPGPVYPTQSKRRGSCLGSKSDLAARTARLALSKTERRSSNGNSGVLPSEFKRHMWNTILNVFCMKSPFGISASSRVVMASGVFSSSTARG